MQFDLCEMCLYAIRPTYLSHHWNSIWFAMKRFQNLIFSGIPLGALSVEAYSNKFQTYIWLCCLNTSDKNDNTLPWHEVLLGDQERGCSFLKWSVEVRFICKCMHQNTYPLLFYVIKQYPNLQIRN